LKNKNNQSARDTSGSFSQKKKRPMHELTMHRKRKSVNDRNKLEKESKL